MYIAYIIAVIIGLLNSISLAQLTKSLEYKKLQLFYC